MILTSMDRTDEFKKAIILARKQNKSNKQHILKKTRQKSDFETKAKKIVQTIGELRSFLNENRKAYISSQSSFNEYSMTDDERDEIESNTEGILKTCSDTLNILKNQVDSSSTKHVDIHRSLVIEIIQKYLKYVCKIYSEQRAIRVKEVVDRKLISRLHQPKFVKSQPHSSSRNEQSEKLSKQSSYVFNEIEEDEISESEAMQFEQENAQLMKDFSSMVDEVKSIEGKVVEIARLQEVFSEQVLQQEKDIDIVAEKVVESTENIKDGNEELREAIQNNAGFRVWILFFLVMCAFSLLFLDWYS